MAALVSSPTQHWLGHLIHLPHCNGHLFKRVGLVAIGRRGGTALYPAQSMSYGRSAARLTNCASLRTSHARLNQRLGVRGGASCALRPAPHFHRDHRRALAGVIGSAASTEVLRASRLVWKAMSSIMPMVFETCSKRSRGCVKTKFQNVQVEKHSQGYYRRRFSSAEMRGLGFQGLSWLGKQRQP